MPFRKTFASFSRASPPHNALPDWRIRRSSRAISQDFRVFSRAPFPHFTAAAKLLDQGIVNRTSQVSFSIPENLPRLDRCCNLSTCGVGIRRRRLKSPCGMPKRKAGSLNRPVPGTAGESCDAAGAARFRSGRRPKARAIMPTGFEGRFTAVRTGVPPKRGDCNE